MAVYVYLSYAGIYIYGFKTLLFITKNIALPKTKRVNLWDLIKLSWVVHPNNGSSDQWVTRSHSDFNFNDFGVYFRIG